MASSAQACGPGEPAAHLAAAFPHASVHGTDISEDMVAKATARATSKGLGNLTCHVVDAQSLKPYGDKSQDVVTMCYGLMFVPSLVRTRRLWLGFDVVSLRWAALSLSLSI